MRELPANIRFSLIEDGNIEICRVLCDELMAFQKAQATMLPHLFDLMNFDTRMKASYATAVESQVIVVMDGEEAVGYVFNTIEDLHKDDSLPYWMPPMEGKILGFFPDWDDLPARSGCLSNFYLREPYRGLGLGTRLLEMSLQWFREHRELDLLFVYISNGNKAALDFYLSHGFTYSHEVFGGFIQAAYMRL